MLDIQKLHDLYGSPVECPSCGTPLVTTDMDVFCPNENCKAKILMVVSQFIKKLEIKNISVASLESFGINSFQGLLEFRPEKKYKSQMKFYKELETKLFKASSPQEIFCALNFHGLNSILLNKLISFYGWETIKKVSSDPDAFTVLRELGLPAGIGEIMLEKFCVYLNKNMELAKMFCADSRYCYEESTVKPETKQSNGKSICFTGALRTMGRGAASKLAEEAGYEVKTSVTKGLTFLVTNDPDSGSSKNRKAQSYGTKIIDENEFIKLVKNNSIFEI